MGKVTIKKKVEKCKYAILGQIKLDEVCQRYHFVVPDDTE
jgi:hypothetical protein